MSVLTRAAEDLHHNQLVPLEFSCSESGFVTLTVNDRNGNDTLGTGDDVAITYESCNGVASGPISLRVTEIGFDSGIISMLSGDFSIDLTYWSSTEPTLTATGNMEFTATSLGITWLATDFRDDYISGTNRETLTDARVEVVFNESTAYSFAFSGMADSDAVGGSYEVGTETPFLGDGGQWPMTGGLTATGRDDSEIRYLANDGSEFATVEVDADGNGVIDDLAHGVEWTEISSGVVFGADGSGVPPPPTGPNLLGRRIALSGTAEDLAVNASRGHVYVTIPEKHELLVFSASTLEVVRRIHLGSRPAGLSVSEDGDEIFVGLSASGAIAILDADSFVETRIVVAPALESAVVYKVVETAPGILYVSTGVPNSQGHIARVDRGTGAVTPIATTAFNEIELLADPTRNLLYVSDGDQAAEPTVRKLDAGAAGTPQLSAFSITTGSQQMDRLSLSPSGLLIYTASGDSFNTEDFTWSGRITSGVPWASNNGTEVMVARAERDIVIHSAETLREIDRLETDCWSSPQPGFTFGQVQRLMQSPVNGQWLLLGDEVLCVVDLLNPHVPPGTGEPGVLPEPIPTTTITTGEARWGNTISDAEYDDVRKRLYVSLYSAQELVTVDAENFVILERQPLDHTVRGLDLSPDGSTLAMMFNDNGHIAFKDLDSGAIETQDISALLGTVGGFDVQWLDDDILFASADPPCCDEPMAAHLVRVNRSDPDASRRSAGGAGDLWAAELAISPDRHSLFLNRGSREVLKLDLTQVGEPVVAGYVEPETGGLSGGGFSQPNISPDGQHIAYANQKVLKTSDLLQAGEIGWSARSLFSMDGTTIYGAIGEFIDRYDPLSFSALERLVPTGHCNTPWRFLTSADGRTLITAEQGGVCFWLLDQPVTQAFKLKAHDPYTCGPACMMRNHARRSGVHMKVPPMRH